MRWMFLISWLLFSVVLSAEPIVISHSELQSYKLNGNTLTGIATPSLGANDSEVWQSSIDVGSQTPLHTHETEEIVILVAGEIDAVVENKSIRCSAPCTIILPANKQHQLKNCGTIPTNHFLVMPGKSKIIDSNSKEMILPWRK